MEKAEALLSESLSVLNLKGAVHKWTMAPTLLLARLGGGGDRGEEKGMKELNKGRELTGSD